MAEAPAMAYESSSRIVVSAEWMDQVGSGSGEAWQEDLRSDKRGSSNTLTTSPSVVLPPTRG